MTKKTESPKKKRSAPGWRIPDPIRQEFTAWCDERQRKYERELAKALFLWIHEGSLLRDVVEQAIAGDPEFGPEFWRTFEEQCDATVRELRRRPDTGASRPTR